MAAIVPPIARRLSYSEIFIADPVRGGTWRAAAECANYLIGRGGTVIPYTAINQEIQSATTYTLRFNVKPRIQATRRQWLIGMAAPDTGGEVEFTDPSGGSWVYRIPAGRTVLFDHLETVDTPTNSEEQWTVTLESGTLADSLYLTMIACFENARYELAVNATDDGIDTETFNVEAPICSGTGLSLGGLASAVPIARNQARRNSLYQVVRLAGAALEWSTGSYVNLLAFDVPVLERMIRTAADVPTASVLVRAYTRSDVTTGGTLRLTAASGASTTIAVPANDTGTWRTSTLAVHTEDLSAADGRRSTTWDTIAVEGIRTSGAGKCYLESLSILGRES